MQHATSLTYALVTGATSGIGYELARLFAAEGKGVVLVARLEDRLAEVADELRGLAGADVRTIAVDLFAPDGADEVHRRVRDAGIVVDVLVNNAGQGEYGAFAGTDLERQRAIVRLNIDALMVLTHRFLNDMLARGHGRILQLGSLFSRMPAPLMGVYAATKAFVLSFSEALIEELADTDVTVTVLMPGATDTDFFHKAGAERSRVYGESSLSDPAAVARDGYAALMVGKRGVIPGLKNKLQAAIADHSPSVVNTKLAHAVNRPNQRPDADTRTEPTHEPSRREREALEGTSV